jgi:cyclin-dependent kinase 12/13
VRGVEAYEELDEIGVGQYGEVYLARERAGGALVALKKIRMENEKEGFPITACREIKILAGLEHGNVVSLIEVVAAAAQPDNGFRGDVFMVLEYMDHDLAGLADRPGVRFQPAQVKAYALQLARALAYCHARGVLHRDLKASNVLLSNTGTLKLADFGLARRSAGADALTNKVVTRWYRPPELLLGATRYGPEIDMWSCGCVLAEMLIGRALLPGNDEADQIELIFRTCGSPTDATWPGASALPFYDMFRPKVPMRRCLREALGHGIAPDAVDLVDRLLAMDPGRRLSAEGMLRHDYFRRAPPPCPPGSMPVYEPCHQLQMQRRRAEAKAAAEAEAAAQAAARRAAEEAARAAERKSTPTRGAGAPPDCMLRLTPPRTAGQATPPHGPLPPPPPPPPPPQQHYGGWVQPSRAAGMGFGAHPQQHQQHQQQHYPPPPPHHYQHHQQPYGGHYGGPPAGPYGGYPPPPPPGPYGGYGAPPPPPAGYYGHGHAQGGYGPHGQGGWGEPAALTGESRFYAQALARETPRAAPRHGGSGVAAAPRRGPRPAAAPVPFYSAAALAASPSAAAGISASDEAAYRGVFVAFLRDMSRAVRLPAPVTATAAVYGLRFYAQHSYGEYANRSHVIGSACLLLAAKVEGAPKLVADLAAASYALRLRGAELLSDGHKHAYPRERENILEAERRVVRAIGFQFNARHALDDIILARKRLITLADELTSPQREAAPMPPPPPSPSGAPGRLSPVSPARDDDVVEDAKPSIPAPPRVAFDARSLAQAAMSFANDSLATTLPLQYDAGVLAGAFLQLAAALTGAPLGPPHLSWALQASLPPQALRDVAAQVAAFYRASGNVGLADRLAERLGLDDVMPAVEAAHASPLSDAPEAVQVEAVVEAARVEEAMEAAPHAAAEPDAGAEEASKRRREEEEAERLAMLAPQRRVRLA